MAEAVTARWHGDNYQARIFWENAFNLLMPESCVVEVTFEANGPKSFDDVVVRYDPAVARSGSKNVPADYHQVKWHVEYGGRFGHADFIDPEFIGAMSMSLLERLRDAKSQAPEGSNFTFLTTYRVRDDDPLAELISGTDKMLLLDRLFDGTRTDRSRMGKVRKLWRDHLGLATDEELREVLQGLRVLEGHRSLDELREEINFRARAVGVLACHRSDSDFRFDELARQLKVRRVNSLSRELFLELCGSERLLAEAAPIAPRSEQALAIRSFIRSAADQYGALPENTLLLTDLFTERYLRADQNWQADIRPRVEGFLRAAMKRDPRIRLVLDAHASIAFLSGSVLDPKSGSDVTLVQKGRTGEKMWRSDDGLDGAEFICATHMVGREKNIAVLISATHNVQPAAEAYIRKNLRSVGKILHLTPAQGSGPNSIVGGTHAAKIADQITRELRAARATGEEIVHLFAASPNTLVYYLGQQHRGIAPVIVYEFDFDRRGNRSYQPSFLMD